MKVIIPVFLMMKLYTWQWTKSIGTICILLWILGVDSTSLCTGGYNMGTLLVNNAVIFCLFYTNLKVRTSRYSTIVIGLGTSGVTSRTPSALGTQKPVEVNCCKSWI